MNLVCLIVLFFPSGLICSFSVRWVQVELPVNVRKLRTAIQINEKNQLDVSFSDGKHKSPPIKCNCKQIGYHFSASQPMLVSFIDKLHSFLFGVETFALWVFIWLPASGSSVHPFQVSARVSDQASFITCQDGSSQNQHNATDSCHLPVCPLG